MPNKPKPPRLLAGLAIALLLLGLSDYAGADEPVAAPSAAAAPAPGIKLPCPPEPSALCPLFWRREPGQGVGFGYDAGLWGSAWAQELRIIAPLGKHFALHGRGLYLLHFPSDDNEESSAFAGGRLDLIGRSVALLNVVRLYGGGGVQVLARVQGPGDRKPHVGGGGQFGFEFFQRPSFSFFLEVGGQGSLPSISGAAIVAGMNFYPWTS